MVISLQVFPPGCLLDNPINAVTTKFVRTSTNKLRCPIFCVAVSTINLGNCLCVFKFVRSTCIRMSLSTQTFYVLSFFEINIILETIAITDAKTFHCLSALYRSQLSEAINIKF